MISPLSLSLSYILSFLNSSEIVSSKYSCHDDFSSPKYVVVLLQLYINAKASWVAGEDKWKSAFDFHSVKEQNSKHLHRIGYHILNMIQN